MGVIEGAGDDCPHCQRTGAFSGGSCRAIWLEMRTEPDPGMHPLTPRFRFECRHCGKLCIVTLSLTDNHPRGHLQQRFRALLQGTRLVRRAGGSAHAE